jgi:hypothetical protein
MSGAAWRRKEKEISKPPATSLLQLVADSRKHAHLHILLATLTHTDHVGFRGGDMSSAWAITESCPASKACRSTYFQSHRQRQRMKEAAADANANASPAGARGYTNLAKNPPPNSVLEKIQGAKTSTRLARMRPKISRRR